MAIPMGECINNFIQQLAL